MTSQNSEQVPSKDLVAGLQKIRRRVSGELDGTWMLHSEAVAVLAEIERLQVAEVELDTCGQQCSATMTSLLAEVEQLKQCQREGWNYAREVEDEYRNRTGHGFGDGPAQPPKERDLLAELRALPAGYRLLGYTAAEELERRQRELDEANDTIINRALPPLKTTQVCPACGHKSQAEIAERTVAEINAAVDERLDRVERELAAWSCPMCHTINSGERRFCVNCDHDVRAVQPPEQLEGPCPNCNQWVVLKPETAFCCDINASHPGKHRGGCPAQPPGAEQ